MPDSVSEFLHLVKILNVDELADEHFEMVQGIAQDQVEEWYEAVMRRREARGTTLHVVS
jgi:hypothetical protein